MSNNELLRININEYQKELLTILDSVVEICSRHNLEYYLSAGSLLGAIRHGGFIPWDDDVDLCMPRTDYERFLLYADNELPEHLRSVWFGNQDRAEHPQYYCQVRDSDFPIVQMSASVPRRTNAWIDVFPLDGMPKNTVPRLIHSLRLLYWRLRMQLSMFDRNVNINRKNRPAYEKALIWIFGKTGWGSAGDTYRIMRNLDRALKRYSDAKSPLWVNFMGAYKLKETVAVKEYRDGKLYSFEGRRLTGPKNADAVLKKLYGEYMTPVQPSDTDEHQIYLELKGQEKANNESINS